MSRTWTIEDEANEIATDKSINIFKRQWLLIKLYVAHFRSKRYG